PTIATSRYASAALDMNALWAQQNNAANQFIQQRRVTVGAGTVPTVVPKLEEIVKMPNTTRRLVQVFIADPDDNVPLASALIYKGEPKFTDLTDQELFFEVDIKSILDKHNELRVTLKNKAVKERVEMLEPARIRDLKMTVVNIATF